MTAFWARGGVTGIHDLLMFHLFSFGRFSIGKKGSIPGDFGKDMKIGMRVISFYSEDARTAWPLRSG
jgi:hypothetical protein